jgi:hypothetical protein
MTTPAAARFAPLALVEYTSFDASGYSPGRVIRYAPGTDQDNLTDLLVEIRTASGSRVRVRESQVRPPSTGPAAKALAGAIETAYGLSRTHNAPAAPALELAGDVIDVDDGSWGMLAVYDGTVVRITVEPARPEEAAAVLGVTA